MERFDTPQEMIHDCWHLLFRATVEKRHPMATPVIGTVEAGACRLRTVILREVDIQGRRLVFYTDRRSAKVSQLESMPGVSWHFYDPKKQVQIRARGVARFQSGDEQARSHWENISVEGRKNYAATEPPGTPAAESTRGLPDWWEGGSVSLADTEYAFEQFMVVDCRIDFLDLLMLDKKGHQRTLANWKDEKWQATWVVA